MSKWYRGNWLAIWKKELICILHPTLKVEFRWDKKELEEDKGEQKYTGEWKNFLFFLNTYLQSSNHLLSIHPNITIYILSTYLPVYLPISYQSIIYHPFYLPISYHLLSVHPVFLSFFLIIYHLSLSSPSIHHIYLTSLYHPSIYNLYLSNSVWTRKTEELSKLNFKCSSH